MPTSSARFALNATDARKLGKGLLIALAGSALAYASQEAAPILTQVGLPYLIPLASLLVNAGLKWLQGPS